VKYKASSFYVAVVIMCVSMVCGADRSVMEIERDLFQADRKAIVAEAMQLSELDAAKFWPLYNEYRDASRVIGDRTFTLLKTYAEAYRASSLTDEQASELTDQHLKIEQDRFKLKKKYLKKFRKVFSGKLVARYFQVESKLEALMASELAKDVPLVSLEGKRSP